MTYQDVVPEDPGFLRTYEIPIDGGDDEIRDFAAGDEGPVKRQYLAWYIPISGGDGMRLRGQVPAPQVLSGVDTSLAAMRITLGMS